MHTNLPNGLTDWLRNYSAEVIASDRRSVETAGHVLRAGTEVFVPSLPSDTGDRQILAAVQLRRAGLVPVPHLVARNIPSRAEFDERLRRLKEEAGVDRALILAGDRDRPAGDFSSSLQLLETALLERHGIRRIFLSCYPEVHPRIAAADLLAARSAKLAAAVRADLDVTLVSQFCFEAAPIIEMARHLRLQGVTAPLRVGVAGPAGRGALLKYALLCGIGASVRALKERPGARGMLTADTPEVLLEELARAQAAQPALDIRGVHFFTFASLAATVEFAASLVTTGAARRPEGSGKW